MKKIFIIPLLALALASCSGNKQSTNTVTPDSANNGTEQLSLAGKWRLTDYPGETEMVVISPEKNYILEINAGDNSFGMNTDCNSIGGSYKLDGEDLSFSDILSTMRYCPDEKVESAMKSILPMVTSYSITPDSVLMLRADGRIMAQFKYVNE